MGVIEVGESLRMSREGFRQVGFLLKKSINAKSDSKRLISIGFDKINF